MKLVSDQPQAHVQAVERMKGWTVSQLRMSSKAARIPQNPLWTTRLGNLFVRHGGADHELETTAFSRRAQGAPTRLTVVQVTRNSVRVVQVRDGKWSPSPAMKLGRMRE